ncbi:hypothetical protein EZV62_007701 [Acer yangbiense]|uniref:hAT-like transposase RNase-H fold domain-containing protein n=1 Tax=Acer yangbiense TaxID=1000413 RepID=A0A5C7ID86_9ROSI|nr:hypothetical protein EZV62_007701 [Acer yangbiense]
MVKNLEYSHSRFTMAENSNATTVEPSEILTTDEALVATDAGTKRRPTKTPSKVWIHFTQNEGAHFIDSGWELHKRILNFCVVPNHKGETIGKIIEACLLDWGIERVFTITVDNASANDVAVKYVKRKLSNWVTDGIILEEDESVKRKMGPPRFDDWETSKVFVKFLKKFYDATLKFSASLSVTSNLYFHEVFSIQSELTELSTNTDPFLGTMPTSMKRKYDKYWCSIESINKLLLISVVLDPRYKLDYVTFCLGHLYGNDKGEEMTKGLKELLCRLYECYNGRNSNSICTQSSNDFQLLNGMNVDKDKHDGDFRFAMLQKFKKMRETKDCIDTKNEVDRYMLEPSEDPYNENFDILLWWKLNATKYQV